MRVSLYKGEVGEYNPRQKKIFERLVENSFKELSSSQEIFEDTIPWKLVFKIEEPGLEEYFSVDTQGEFLAYLDLDGYLSGQRLELDDERDLKIVSKYSYMYEVLCFSEILKFGVLEPEKIEILEKNIFPEWANGIVADDLENNEVVAEFMRIFTPVLDNMGVLKRIDVDIVDFQVDADSEEVKEEFKRYIRDYIDGEIFFLVHNPLYAEIYTENFPELLEAVERFDPETINCVD